MKIKNGGLHWPAALNSSNRYHHFSLREMFFTLLVPADTKNISSS